MMRCSTVFLLLTVASVQACLATSPQKKDVVFWGGTKFQAIQLPLEERLKNAEKEAGETLLKPNTSTNLKGYSAAWRITKGNLVLERFSGVFGDRNVSYSDLFVGEVLPTKAVWFSGKLSLPVGEFDFDSGVYPILIELDFEKGKLLRTKCVQSNSPTR